MGKRFFCCYTYNYYGWCVWCGLLKRQLNGTAVALLKQQFKGLVAMGNIRGGRVFWHGGGLRPLPPLLIAKVIFSTFRKMEQFNSKMEQFEIKWRKCISMSKHISLFSPLFIWSYLRFLVSLHSQSLKINSYEKSTLCYSGILY